MIVYVQLHGALRGYSVDTTDPEIARQTVQEHLSGEGFVRFLPVLAVVNGGKQA